MYVTDKELETIAEVTALVDTNLESLIDDDIIKYWKGFSKRVNDLEIKMQKQNLRQKL